MAMFMENYRKQQAVIEEGSRDKYSNFFAEAYQVSEDIDLQIMMSEMTVELRDILYSEADDSTSKDGVEGAADGGKVGFGAKVVKFIRRILSFIKRIGTYIVDKIMGGSKEMREQKEKYRKLTKNIEKLLDLILESDVKSMSKLLIPANKLAVLIKFSLYDIIAFKKFNELYSLCNEPKLRDKLEKAMKEQGYINLGDNLDVKNQTPEKLKSIFNNRLKYLEEKVPELKEIIKNFKGSTDEIYLKIMTIQITSRPILDYTRFDLDKDFDEAGELLKNKDTEGAINLINKILNAMNLEENEPASIAFKEVVGDNLKNEKITQDIFLVITGYDGSDGADAGIKKILSIINSNVSDDDFNLYVIGRAIYFVKN